MQLTTLKTRAPAKLNIRLKITGRRADGYHELVSIMVPVGIFDYLDLKVISEGVDLICEGINVPADENNLVYQAARTFLSLAGIKEGISIKLIKKIPVSAGLGGGSSDAAAILISLNKIWSMPFDLPSLHNMAVGLGADVPFFLNCRPSLATGIGEVLEPLDKWTKSWYIIVTPPIHVSTSWVYGNLKIKLTTDEYTYISNLLKGDGFPLSQVLENDLEDVTSVSFPIIKDIKDCLLDAGADGALMSGSGPSVFGVFSSLEKAASAKQFLISRDMGDVFMATEWERS